MKRRPLEPALVVLFVFAALLLSFPLLLIWDQPGSVLGIPLLPLGLFLVWGGVIGLLGWLVGRRRS
jgi:hypothetical protein